MNKMKKIILMLMLVMLIVPVADAAPKATVSAASNEFCRVFETAKVVGVIESGTVVFCIAQSSVVSNTTTGQTQLSATITGPQLTGDSYSVTIVPVSGCAIATTYPVLTFDTTSGGGESQTVTLNHTAASCLGYVVGAAGTTFMQYLAFNSQSQDSVGYVASCDAASSTTECAELRHFGLEYTAAFFPLIAFLGFFVWAEKSRITMVYTAAIVSGIAATVTLWDGLGTEGITTMVILLILALARTLVGWIEGNETGSKDNE
jgi:hypothetical protein